MTVLSHAIENVLPKKVDVWSVGPDLAVDPGIPTYAGGLGVLDGGKYAEMQHNYARHQTDIVFVGILPPYGYNHQVVRTEKDRDGNPYHRIVPTYIPNPHPDAVREIGRLKLMLDGEPCYLAVSTPAHLPQTHARILLLGSDIPENSERHRLPTRSLYIEGHGTEHWGSRWSDKQWMQAMQAAILGLGAVELHTHTGANATFMHGNDSHFVLGFVWLIGQNMAKGMSYEQARAKVAEFARYTNHTIVPAGNRSLRIEHIARICRDYPGFDYPTLAMIAGHDTYFRMTTAMCNIMDPGRANAVSEFHARVASNIFGYRFIPITNGVYVPWYQDPRFAELKDPMEIWPLKRAIKREVLSTLRRRGEEAGWQFNNIHTQDMLGCPWIALIKRMHDYKRNGLPWRHTNFPMVKRLLELRQFAFLWGGKFHPDDDVMGDATAKYFNRFCGVPNAMFVFNYDMELMLHGLRPAVDIWTGAPFPGTEACSTSPMTGALNGAIIVHTLDGYIGESKYAITYGATASTDSTGSLMNEKWNAYYEMDAADFWTTTLPIVYKIRNNDPALAERAFAQMKEAEEQFSATVMVDKYRQKLWVK